MKSRRAPSKKKPRPKPEPPTAIKAHSKPELLAPAGSPASWAAAVEAGADAVYLGLKSYSARAFAANFTPAELARAVDLSHERGVKVFVAFNSLLKDRELPDAARALEGLTRIGPDALILQDLGLLRLIKKHFPHFETHASTLMAGHNMSGLTTLKNLGFDRAVLARELSLREVERLTARAPLGLEIFIHGALCFSFSGLCLMSSFLGGKGSLRGACTQPCRRLYESGRGKGYFFSPTDLEALDLMAAVRNLPLSALKIEGRMKGPDYVSRVVRAYRLLLDVPEDDLPWALEDARALIESSPGRQRSNGFLRSPRAEDALAPRSAATSGLFLGRVSAGGPEGGIVTLKERVEIGDRLRVQFKQDDERQAFTLKAMLDGDRPLEEAGPDREVRFQTPFPLSAGDLVFKVGSGREEKEAAVSDLVKALEQGRSPGPAEGPRLKKALDWLKPGPTSKGGSSRRPELWYRLARTEDASGLAQLKPGRIILPVTTANVRRLAGLRRRLGDLVQRLIWAPPPLVFNEQILARDLEQLMRMGAREFMVSNPGHLTLLREWVKPGRGRVTLYGDWRLNCLNAQTEAVLADLGLSGLTISLETDEENLKELLARPAQAARILYLYGRPPLFTSRLKPAGLKSGQPVISPKKERFRVYQDQQSLVAVAEKPVSFASLLKYRHLGGVTAFLIDLEYDPRPLASAKEVTEAVHRGRPMRNTSRFNFERGLF